MKSTSKFAIILLISLLSIGFAAVATNLIINGNTKISTNPDDFDIYFSKAIAEEGGSATIDSSTKKSISYSTKMLKEINDQAILNYTVYNNSANYDANVSINFTAVDLIDGIDYSSYYTVERVGFDTNTVLLPGKTEKNGKIIITLVKSVTSNVEISFTLTLTASAVERTQVAEGPAYEILSGDLDTVGSEVRIANEEFYVIGQEDEEHVRLLAKWNLKIGNIFDSNAGEITGEYLESDVGYGLQSSDVRGIIPDEPISNGGIAFSDEGYWEDNNNTPYEYEDDTLRPEYGTGYPAYVYDSNSLLKQYVDNYASYLNSQGVNVTGELIRREELVSLGCNLEGVEDYIHVTYCSPEHGASAPEWLYQTSYWAGSADKVNAIHVYTLGFFGNNYYDWNDWYKGDTFFGLRPVIILEK